jgi:hypothetical protein
MSRSPTQGKFDLILCHCHSKNSNKGFCCSKGQGLRRNTIHDPEYMLTIVSRHLTLTAEKTLSNLDRLNGSPERVS